MGFILVESGYLDNEYLTSAYSAGFMHAYGAFQATLIIEASQATAIQSTNQIVDKTSPTAIQATNTIESSNVVAFQSTKVIQSTPSTAFQFFGDIQDFPTPIAFQAKQDTLLHTRHGYLEGGYLEDSYLAELMCGVLGMQASITIIDFQSPTALQSLNTIIDKQSPTAFQANIVERQATAFQSSNEIVDKESPTAFQVNKIIEFQNTTAQQANLVIEAVKALAFEAKQDTLLHKFHGYLESGYMQDPYLVELICAFLAMQSDITINTTSATAFQSLLVIDDDLTLAMQSTNQIVDKENPIAFQANSVRAVFLAFQALKTLYSTTNLRILCEFPSRGLTNSNWFATTTAAGDHDVSNLDSDVVEETWKSTSVINQFLTNDTGVPQGVAIDTLGILNHNLTTSATVRLQGSSDPSYVTLDTNVVLTVTANNMFYIAADLPNSGSRFWRLNIDDPTNVSGFLEIGSIVFGAADTFQANCFKDEIIFDEDDFVNSVRTEGQTTVGISRSYKRTIGLDFVDVSIDSREYKILSTLFRVFKTTHKCLWIPTPNPDDPEETARFAVFGKLEEIPSRTVNAKGPGNNHASFSVNVTEAK